MKFPAVALHTRLQQARNYMPRASIGKDERGLLVSAFGYGTEGRSVTCQIRCTPVRLVNIFSAHERPKYINRTARPL